MKFKNIIFLGCAATIAFLGCRKEGCTDKLAINFDSEAKKDDGSCTYDDGSYIVPTTYTFTDADGRITVSYSGQTDRLNMLQEMKDYMKTGTDAAVTLDVQKLKDMYANTNSPWTSSDLNASSKQLENKTFSLDMATFKSYLDSVASHSAITTSASEGVAGSLTSSDGNSSYLVDANGWEYPQLFEKGIMGSVFYYQIAEVYTRDGKIGATVNNTDPVDAAGGKYYTEMEHHWDEAFGYFGVPTDFPSNTDGLLHIGKYCNSRNGILTTLNQDVMDQYLIGRAAISNGDMTAKDAAAAAVRKQVEMVFAATAIHYFNDAKENIADDAKRSHLISEAIAFTRCLKYNIDALITSTQIADVENHIGTNLYQVTSANLDAARDVISSVYGLDAVKANL